MLFANTQKKHNNREMKKDENIYAESTEREIAEKRILLLLDKFHCRIIGELLL